MFNSHVLFVRVVKASAQRSKWAQPSSKHTQFIDKIHYEKGVSLKCSAIIFLNCNKKKRNTIYIYIFFFIINKGHFDHIISSKIGNNTHTIYTKHLKIKIQ